MSTIRDPATDQAPPRATTGPALWPLVIADAERLPDSAGLIADMRARHELGQRKYGQPLQAHNGRSALRDLYDELLDAVVYARQCVEEGHGLVALYARLLDQAAQVQMMIQNPG